MTTPADVVEGPYLADLLAQPGMLRGLAAALGRLALAPSLAEGWAAGRYRRVVLTGMGSSLHALYPLHRALSARGVASLWAETAELLHGFDGVAGHDTLLVAVSQSGESAEVVALLGRGREFGHVVGVTNDEASTLGRAAGTVLPLDAGPEATVSCKTYVATLVVLRWLAARLGAADPAAVADEAGAAARAAGEYLAGWRGHVADLLPLLDGVSSVFVTGRGDSLASAGTGGLILKEATRRHAEGMSAAAFRHGPLEMADARALVLVFEGDADVAPLHHRLVADVLRGGGRAALVAGGGAAGGALRPPAVPAGVRPVMEILPVQMLSLALAARDGVEAGRFARASKITTTA